MMDMNNNKGFSDEQYRKLKSRIMGRARKLVPDDADPEDVAHEVLATWFSQSRPCGQTVDQAVIDYVRSNYGRKGANSNELRKNLRRADALSFEPSAPRDSGARSEIARLAKLFRGDERKIIELLSYGYNQQEIADEFNLTESRISQRLKVIKKKMERISTLTDLISGLKLNNEPRKWIWKVSAR